MKLEELLKLPEGKSIEYKKAKNELPKSFWETYSAFANSDGGVVILGVDEKNNKVTGVENPLKIRDDLFNTLNNQQKVSKNLLSDDDVKIIQPEENKQVVFIFIPEAPYADKPIYLNNTLTDAYERLGEGDRKLSPKRYKALVVGSQEITDNEQLKGYDLSDLDEESLKTYRNLLYKQTNNEKYQSMDYIDMLIEVGAMRKDRQGDGEFYLTIGGLLFFGKINAITDRFPGFQLDYFEKTSPLVTDWEDRVSTGDSVYPDLNVFSFFRLVLEKLETTIKDAFLLDEESKLRLPFKNDLMVSVREAIVNALMHAYYDSDMPIKITAYDDYYEFINPGKMRITVEEFIHGGNSNIRNHTMSSIMRRVGIAEKAGSGGPRIFDVASKYNLKTPDVLREQDRTVVRIWKVDLEKTFEVYPENQQKILHFLVKNHSITRGEANSELSLDAYAFRIAVNELQAADVIVRMGKGRATRYILKPSTSESSFSIKHHLRMIEDYLVRRDND